MISTRGGRPSGSTGSSDSSTPLGQWSCPPRYEQASRFRHGLAEVSNDTGVILIDQDGNVVATTEFRRPIPISRTVVAAYFDDRDAAAQFSSLRGELAPALWRDPSEEDVFVISEVTLYSIEHGRIPTPPVRSIQLIPGTSGVFWLKIAEPGDGWDRYDWGLMREDGKWVIGPGIMDVVPLPNGLTLIFNPPDGVARKYHDSYFGWELEHNGAGWEAVVDTDGNFVGGQYFNDVGYSPDFEPLVWRDSQWYEVDQSGGFRSFYGEPANLTGRRSLRRSSMAVRPDVLASVHSPGNNSLDCAEGVRLFSLPGPQLGSSPSPFDIRWGLVDRDGLVLVPAEHRYITCPQHGIALVPNEERGAWCPVGPGPQASNASICQTYLWDGWIDEFMVHQQLTRTRLKAAFYGASNSCYGRNSPTSSRSRNGLDDSLFPRSTSILGRPNRDWQSRSGCPQGPPNPILDLQVLIRAAKGRPCTSRPRLISRPFCLAYGMHIVRIPIAHPSFQGFHASTK